MPENAIYPLEGAPSFVVIERIECDSDFVEVAADKSLMCSISLPVHVSCCLFLANVRLEADNNLHYLCNLSTVL